jgi:endonuclease/exonuclease/phosphatase family metal-dependent hydrolase
MIKIIQLVLLAVFGIIISSCASINQNSAPIRVLSFNIRCGYCEPSDSINHWSRRKALVVQTIEGSKADIIGLQEAEKFQVLDLVNAMPQYEWYGIGRDDGGSGEMNAVLIKKSRFSIETKQTIHLSPTPQIVSQGWDAAYKRTLTKLRLRDLSNGKSLNYFNSHFDHIGKLARLNSAILIIDEAKKLGPEPLILTGDFNDRPGFDGYKVLSSMLLDTALTSKTPSKGGDITFNGFGRDLQAGNKIDYIFASPHYETKSHEIITKLYDGNYPSDHFAILSIIQLR